MHLQTVRSGNIHELGSINCEAEIASPVEADLDAIDENSGFVVDRLEVQDDRLATPVFRNSERRGEPHVRDIQFLDSRDSTLDTARNKDFLGERPRRRAVDIPVTRGRLIRPDPVQVLPCIALELGPWVLWPWVCANLVRPGRIQRRCLQ